MKEEFNNLNDLTGKMLKCGHILIHKTGKKRGQEKILGILSQHDSMSQRELQQILGIEAGSLSEVLSKLEKNHLIEKHRDENDKRKFIIALTQAGKNKIEHKKTDDEDMFDMLSQAEQQQLNDILDKILESWHRRHMKYHKHQKR